MQPHPYLIRHPLHNDVIVDLFPFNLPPVGDACALRVHMRNKGEALRIQVATSVASYESRTERRSLFLKQKAM